jgi:hypothetical protein
MYMYKVVLYKMCIIFNIIKCSSSYVEIFFILKKTFFFIIFLLSF